MHHPSFKPIVFAAIVLAVINLLGAFGFWYVENIPPLDALYMSVITVSTVGFKEVRPLDESGKILTMLLIFFGVAAFTFMISAIGNYVVAVRISGLLEQRRMQKKLAEIANHYILCGYGRMGSEVARHFARHETAFVVVDKDPDRVAAAIGEGFLAVAGNGGDDEVLIAAGVDRAAGLLSTLDDDADALFTVVSGRALNPSLFIVARANHKASESKLRKAGAQRVIWPYGDNGSRLAHLAMRPNVVEFFELLNTDHGTDFAVQKIYVVKDSPAVGKSIVGLGIRDRGVATIAAIHNSGAGLIQSPPAETVFHVGDAVIAFGTAAQLAKLSQALQGTPVASDL